MCSLSVQGVRDNRVEEDNLDAQFSSLLRAFKGQAGSIGRLEDYAGKLKLFIANHPEFLDKMPNDENSKQFRDEMEKINDLVQRIFQQFSIPYDGNKAEMETDIGKKIEDAIGDLNGLGVKAAHVNFRAFKNS